MTQEGGNINLRRKRFILYLRLNKRSQNVILQSVLGSYSHIMWVRTEDPLNMIVKVITTEDLVEETMEILGSLKDTVDFDFI